MTVTDSISCTALGPLLKAKFPARHVDAALEHYGTMLAEFEKGEWEKSIVRGGKLVEAVLKTLWVLVGNTVPRAREFKVEVIIRELERIPCTVAEDTVRLTIPRACRFVYDIASNRGARHDADEIDPNVMDASAVTSICGWILAEMLRYSQKGVLDPSKARDLVLGLSQKRFSVIEDVDGRVYFHIEGLSARTAQLLALWRAHPGRINREQLVAAARRHGFSEANARKGLSRLRTVVDDDGQGNLRLLLSGITEAERLINPTGGA